jgi:arsenate reductase
LAVAEELGVETDVILYIKTPPDRKALEKLVAALEDPVEDLVRKDSKFKQLGLDPGDYAGNPDAVIDLLLEHKQLLQRPVLLKGDRAIIGRPKSRIVEFLSAG